MKVTTKMFMRQANVRQLQMAVLYRPTRFMVVINTKSCKHRLARQKDKKNMPSAIGQAKWGYNEQVTCCGEVMYDNRAIGNKGLCVTGEKSMVLFTTNWPGHK